MRPISSGASCMSERWIWVVEEGRRRPRSTHGAARPTLQLSLESLTRPQYRAAVTDFVHPVGEPPPAVAGRSLVLDRLTPRTAAVADTPPATDDQSARSLPVPLTT